MDALIAWLRRADTLFLRLFVLLWVALVLSHLAAYRVVTAIAPPPGWADGRVAAPGAAPPAGGGQPATPGRIAPITPPLPRALAPADEAGRRPPPGGASGPAWADAAGAGAAEASPGWRVPVLPALPPGALGTRPLQLEAAGARPPPYPASGAGPAPPRAPGLPLPLASLDYAVRLLVMGLAAWLGARWLSAPMRRLAEAAQALGDTLGGHPGQPPRRPLLETGGTVEVRRTARVFEQMAQRLQQQFDARSLHMAALSHDLRTPLTRLRLRLDDLPDDPPDSRLRQGSLDDLAEIDALVEETLALLREQRDTAPPPRLDLSALLQSLADDLAEQGQWLQLQLPDMPLQVQAPPVALRRILDNLVGNALRHGGSACLTVAWQPPPAAGSPVGADPSEPGLRLWVDDQGPGIPPAQLAAAFTPWVRLVDSTTEGQDPAASPAGRPLDSPGTGHGLGLHIARSLAERHGLRLGLANRPEGGLRAELWLPPAAVVQASKMPA